MTRSDGTRAKRRTQPPSVNALQIPWVGERWHRVAPRVLAFLVAAIVALSGSKQAVAAPRIYECQHQTVTGQGAYDLLHVSAAEACLTVRALARFIHNGAEGWRLHRCVGRSSTATGRPGASDQALRWLEPANRSQVPIRDVPRQELVRGDWHRLRAQLHLRTPGAGRQCLLPGVGERGRLAGDRREDRGPVALRAAGTVRLQ
jgi:hypothetical protein